MSATAATEGRGIAEDIDNLAPIVHD